MPIPVNPDTIIIKNHYYPKGLTEGEVWNYYRKNKNLILSEIKSRYLMFAIATDINKFILRKNWSKDNPITLTNNTYENRITGRTAAIYSLMRAYEDIAIIDIDSDDIIKAKECVIDTYKQLSKFRLIERDGIHIRFTGKTSFHLVCNLINKYSINRIRENLKDFLSNSDLQKKYTILHKRQKGIPNIDLSPNKMNGAFITANSLSILGLKCTNIDLEKLTSFKPEYNRI